MGIATLGKSLLSSAKKKAKRGQQLGLFAGAAIGVAGIANSVIRRKAMDRFNAFQTSLTPVKKALDKDFVELTNVEAEHKKRSETPGGEFQSFVDEELKVLKSQTGEAATGAVQPSDQMYLDLAKKQASPKYEIYRQRVDAYKPMFGIKADEYYKQYNNLDTLTSAELKNDNLMELIGNKTGLGKNTAQVATEIMLANGTSATLNIPANIREKFDIKYFDEISRRARRAMTTQEIRDIQAIELTEKAKTTDAKALLISVTPKPSSAVKIDETLSTAMNLILEPKLKDGKKDNPLYVGEKFTFMDPDDKHEASYGIDELLLQLEKINFDTQELFKPTELGGMSNKDVLLNKALEYAQILKTNFQLNGSGVITEETNRGWVKQGLQEALKGLSIVTNPGYIRGNYEPTLTLSYAPVDDTPLEVPEPILMLRNRITEYQDNPIGMPSGVLKDIQRMVEEFPDYKDEFSVYLPEENKKEETPSPEPTPSPTPAPAPVTPTSKSLLDMDEAEVMDSAAADKAREEAAAIPGQVVTGVSDFVDAKILENLEEVVAKMKDGKPAIGTSTARVATWLKNTKDISYYKLSKEERIEAIEEYIETLKS
jgi:hypothetical protein